MTGAFDIALGLLFEVVFSPAVSAKRKSSLNATLNPPTVPTITRRTCTQRAASSSVLQYVIVRTMPSMRQTSTVQL